jgi:ribosome maturation factor RimP
LFEVIYLASNKKKGTASAVWELVQPIVEGFDLVLWDVRYEKEGSQWFLRVFIDKEEGAVDITDCENVSRAIDKPLDELDPITDNYILEVSSPGVERELILDEHFEKFIGADIMVKMIRPLEGIGKELKGVLKAYENGQVTIEDHSGENEITISKKDTAFIKLDDFDI